MSPDPNDLSAITPGHLLVGKPLRALPEHTIATPHLNNLERFDVITAAKQQFWRRWSSDYIHELRARTKWTSSSSNLAIGTMVIIHDDNLPAQQWKLGRIEALVPGKDGHVRVVHLRTANGICWRPVHKLATLPMEA
ncbi:GH11068 [Drosophila grimshawi]|uniref:GH11068 n=1 Tax=Drosophila grimshawi TaxID=7222 RepID=B4K1B1_DROGR|nr:GH11068 [Drosophila grimshawi]